MASVIEVDASPTCITCQQQRVSPNDEIGYLCFSQASRVHYTYPVHEGEFVGMNINRPVRSYLSTCGHAMHFSCHLKYIVTEYGRHSDDMRLLIDKRLNQFVCPLCKRLCNFITPYVARPSCTNAHPAADEDGNHEAAANFVPFQTTTPSGKSLQLSVPATPATSNKAAAARMKPSVVSAEEMVEWPSRPSLLVDVNSTMSSIMRGVDILIEVAANNPANSAQSQAASMSATYLTADDGRGVIALTEEDAALANLGPEFYGFTSRFQYSSLRENDPLPLPQQLVKMCVHFSFRKLLFQVSYSCVNLTTGFLTR